MLEESIRSFLTDTDIVQEDLQSRMAGLVAIVRRTFKRTINHSDLWSDEKIQQWLKAVISPADPSPTKENMEWIIKQYANTHYSSEDAEKFARTLTLFAKVKNKAKFQPNPKDINQYKTYADLAKAVAPFSEEAPRDAMVVPGSKLVDSWGKYKLIEITTPEAAEHYAKGTHWCIEYRSHASRYLASGPLYVVLKDGQPYVLIHKPSMQAKDTYDRRINDDIAKELISVWEKLGLNEEWFDDIRPGGAAVEGYGNTGDFLPVEMLVCSVKHFAKFPKAAWEYVVHHKNLGDFERDPDIEAAIAKSGAYSTLYSWNVLGQKRFPAGEPAIATNASQAYQYAHDIIHGRFPLGEPAIAKRSDVALAYAGSVIKGRWEPGEEAIVRDSPNLGRNNPLRDYLKLLTPEQREEMAQKYPVVREHLDAIRAWQAAQGDWEKKYGAGAPPRFRSAEESILDFLSESSSDLHLFAYTNETGLVSAPEHSNGLVISHGKVALQPLTGLHDRLLTSVALRRKGKKAGDTIFPSEEHEIDLQVARWMVQGIRGEINPSKPEYGIRVYQTWRDYEGHAVKKMLDRLVAEVAATYPSYGDSLTGLRLKDMVTSRPLDVWAESLSESKHDPRALDESDKEHIYDLLSSHIPPNRPIHISAKSLSKKDLTSSAQDTTASPKPKGLWYGIGPSWINWVPGEMPHWADPYIYGLDLDYSRVLRITNLEQLQVFDKQYGTHPYTLASAIRYIDWAKVAQKYAGIEINPYIHEARHSVIWYNGWDVASGCIWDVSAIRDIELLVDMSKEWDHVKQNYMSLDRAMRESKHDFSCVLLDISNEANTALLAHSSSIKDSDLAGDGKELKTHVTIKYGLHTNNVNDVLSFLKDHKPIRIKFGKVTSFPPSESSDWASPLKYDIESDDLVQLNTQISAILTCTDTHSDYKPHATLAYVKPDMAKKYEGDGPLTGKEFVMDTVIWSGKDGKEYRIKLPGGEITESLSKELGGGYIDGKGKLIWLGLGSHTNYCLSKFKQKNADWPVKELGWIRYTCGSFLVPSTNDRIAWRIHDAIRSYSTLKKEVNSILADREVYILGPVKNEKCLIWRLKSWKDIDKLQAGFPVESLDEATRQSIWLARYLKDKTIDPYQYEYLISEWDDTKEDIYFADLTPEEQKTFTEWLETGEGREHVERTDEQDPVEADPRKTIDFERHIPPSTWLAHFTNEPQSVATQGFIYGSEERGLHLTTWKGEKERKSGWGTWAFAMEADSREASISGDSSPANRSYGKHAVMFRSTGAIETWHHGDEQRQVIFSRNMAKDFVPLWWDSNSDEWTIQNTETERVIYKTEKWLDMVHWVEQNYAQYQNVIGYRQAGTMGQPEEESLEEATTPGEDQPPLQLSNLSPHAEVL